ncbi:hypothetical protein Goarm_003209 [Gossypium armourianum]|uniref:Uncharacterized protein n=1 Tax=Gossypium armourianum TaxID=34283 RepID=A0A7J9K2G6_9ROSI|nr:hypothetical protein [Gossypium armourianum]
MTKTLLTAGITLPRLWVESQLRKSSCTMRS